MELIHKDKNIEIINDSKATNFDSSIAGINSMVGSSIIISGGILKQGNSEIWVKTIIKKANACVDSLGDSNNQSQLIYGKSLITNNVDHAYLTKIIN